MSKIPYMIEKGYVHYLAEDEYVSFCHEVIIKNKINLIEDDTWFINLQYKDPINQLKEKIIAESQLSRPFLLTLADIGLDVNEENVKEVLQYLLWFKSFPNLEVKTVHKHFGWYHKDDVRTNTYLLEEAIGDDIESTYIGKYNLKPKGTVDEYVSFIKKELSDSPCLQLALTLGLSAPVLGILAEDTDMENLFINLSGNSSTGKSTALMLAMSPWGKSSVSSTNGSLVKSWSSTENALLKTISSGGIQGFPIAFDEAGTNNIKNMNSLLYKVCSGVGKSILSKESLLQEPETFRTVLLSSGEIRILDQMKEKTLGSTVVRLTEFNDFTWTSSAEKSNLLKRFLSRHYGTFSKLFISNLIEYEEDSLFDTWSEYTDILVPRLSPYVKHFADRIASKFAIFLVTFDILIDVLGVEWNIEEIIKLLIESAKDKQDEIKLAENAYEIINTYVAEYNSHFLEYQGNTYSSKPLDKNYSQSIWGKYNDEDITISRSQFQKLLMRNGFTNPKLALMELLKKGAIVPESDRNRANYYNRRTLGTSDKIPVVVIKKNIIFSDEYSKNSLGNLSEG